MDDENQLEIWAGVETTVNRVGDVYFDQLEFNGHCRRPADLELFAELGLRALRYPVLWERLAPSGLDNIDWSWADERLERLRALGLRPIVGLLHHGSGPAYTHLLDPQFPHKLAEYAGRVAERYPWIDAYTPVNEPLTTARFSGLYGHWYPHAKNEAAFTHALLNQVRGIQLAMRAIRQVNPAAQLIQTEDLGKTFSTPGLEYQADFENTRRWLSLDLLTGRMTPQHSLWDYFAWAGAPPALLEETAADPCPPDILGVNYYVTGERFLDGRLDYYAPHLHGGNGFDSYADVEVVRVCTEGLAGAGALLQEVWGRYRQPLAVTEVHLGATREEQLRWWMEVWTEVQRLRRTGVDVRAITAWSLLGAYNWHCLVTRDENDYESGIFDLRAPTPRPTVLAHAIRALAQGQAYDHPVLDTPGWWRRPERLLYPPAPRRDQAAYLGASTTQPATRPSKPRPPTRAPRPILITGGAGTLGQALARVCHARGLEQRLLTRRELDITDPEQIRRVVAEIRPWAVINAAGYVRVDDAEREPERCMQVNAAGAAHLAQTCADQAIRFLTFSSDLVFDGTQGSPYTESAPVAPLNVYGRSKAESEHFILENVPQALVVRTSAFFGPWDHYNFAAQALHTLAEGGIFSAAGDVFVSPTYVPDLVHSSLDLLIDGETGLWHLANRGAITWFGFARLVAEMSGVDTERIQPASIATLALTACRPRYSVLGSERALLLPPLEDAVERFAHAVAP